MNSRLAKKIKNTTPLLTLGICAALSGCSGPPSASEGRQAIEDQIKRDSEGRIRLVQFQKTNGQQGELAGIKMYGLEFEAEIEFTEDCRWDTGPLGAVVSFRTTKPVVQPQSGFSWQSFMDNVQNPGTLVKRSQRVKLTGTVSFEKKEKGWWMNGVKVTSITAVSGSGNASAPQTERSLEHRPSGPSSEAALAVSECREKAEKGYVNAQYELAMLYSRGQNIETNMVEAVKWYREAAEKGHSAAQLNLGITYLVGGGGIKQDFAEAEKWVRKAAEQNATDAQFLLGEMYSNGSGAPQNREMAIGLFQKVAASDSEHAEVAKVRIGELDRADGKGDTAGFIGPAEASAHTGKHVTIVGIVAQVSPRPSLTFLNLGEPYPNTPLTAIIRNKSTNEFENLSALKGKVVSVTGEVNDYNGKAEMELTRKSQLNILSDTK